MDLDSLKQPKVLIAIVVLVIVAAGGGFYLYHAHQVSMAFNDDLNSGKSALSNKKYDEAISDFEKAEKLKPKDKQAPKLIDKAQASKKQAQERAAFMAYWQSVKPIIVSEQKLSNEWDQLRKNGGSMSNAQVVSRIRDITSKSNQLESKAEDVGLTIASGSPYLSLNKQLIKAANENFEAMTTVLSAIGPFGSVDYSKITQANAKLAAGRSDFDAYARKLKDKGVAAGVDVKSLLATTN